MSNHFDITLERKLESSADDAPDVGSQVRRIELITGTGRRRRWSSDDKARILMESFAPGSCVSDVARRNGLSPQQLFAWRREARALFQEDNDQPAATHAAAPSSELGGGAPQFVPVVRAASAPSSLPPGSPPSPPRGGVIEIVIGDAVVRVSTPVDAAALTAVLAAVRRTS